MSTFIQINKWKEAVLCFLMPALMQTRYIVFCSYLFSYFNLSLGFYIDYIQDFKIYI